ncbi:hypothetical protein [Mycoplasmoides fastidiosum]|uniref:hypothetical protein n=1 Tax=Mycoplasmoides fastidiosum TaxID=92758 RepID=UPI00211445BF|nr:hypothetical protein [Mycoplasmoides fastidiosum]UUD37828.1 hypothetical protein NPA10_00310 [Mycoplasmoides fastidiosum]
MFKTNFLVLFAGNNLYVAGIGFWIILFPAVFVGLPEYVVPINNIDETLNNLHHDFFSYFWNHCITQICYFLFTISVFRSGDKNFMYPAKIRNLFASILIWSTYYIVIFGIALSLTTKIFPVYGIFSNFNPNTIYETYNGHKLFNGRVLSVSIIGIYLIGLIIVYLNWRISIQLNSDTSKKLLKNIDLK